jgi:hypothetical protein
MSSFALDDIYNEDYAYVGGNSAIKARQDWLIDTLLRLVGERKFNRVIEVGCNNLILMRAIKKAGIRADHWIGIDPVPQAVPVDASDGIMFINDYTQNVDLPYFDPALPDLIIADQVMEHIPSLNDFLHDINQRVGVESTYMICVPSMELLVENLSFHNIIHEHLNYFSARTLANLFEQHNLRLKYCELNNKQTAGYLLQFWEKSDRASLVEAFKDPAELLQEFRQKFQFFKDSLKLAIAFLNSQRGKYEMYGFGASDITANLAYFAETDFSMLGYIIDDTPYKQGKYIPLIKPKIGGTHLIKNMDDAIIFVTAPQAARPIASRLIQLGPRKILYPFSLI